jgi:hypothetical protein
MTDDFPRDRSANPADIDDDLHDADANVTPSDEETSARGPISTGTLPGADATMGDDESFGETGLEDRNVGFDPGDDVPGGLAGGDPDGSVDGRSTG